jgi:hypothetical protein
LHLHRGRNISFLDGDIAKGVHQIRDFHMLRAPFKTGIAGRTQPDKLAGKDLFFHTEESHPNDLSRIVPVGDLSDGAACRTGPTGEAFLDMLSPRFPGDQKFEIRIKVF